jgi:hypothetical protein
MKEVYPIFFNSKYDEDSGIECICENKEFAEWLCSVMNNEHKDYIFFVDNPVRYHEDKLEKI